MTPKEYDALVRQLSPKSPIWKDTALAAVPNTITGPATVNILTAVPVISPSARKSMAGEATALAKPVMGTNVPAPAYRASR